MWRKFFTCLLAAMIFVCLSTFSAWANPIINFNVLDSDIGVGETFGVEVWANENDVVGDLLTFGFDVSTGGFFSFDKSNSVIESGFWDVSGPGDNVAGDIFAGLPCPNVLLATLSFTALAEGSDLLSVVGNLGDGFNGLRYSGLQDFAIFAQQDITISSAPVPSLFASFNATALFYFRCIIKKLA